jgi:hypothetical protein
MQLYLIVIAEDFNDNIFKTMKSDISDVLCQKFQ